MDECTDCKYFLGCECFSGKTCDMFTPTERSEGMNDNDVIKALEYIADTEDYKLTNYPDPRAYNATKVINLSLDLINRLQAEKEALINGQETLQKYIAEQKAEIENLRAENKEKTETISFLKEQLISWSGDYCKLKEQLKTAKSEARKEFADKLKLDAQVYDEYDGEEEYFYMYVTVEDIDNLLKELDGKEKV